jgi:hypothetical protein
MLPLVVCFSRWRYCREYLGEMKSLYFICPYKISANLSLVYTESPQRLTDS